MLGPLSALNSDLDPSLWNGVAPVWRESSL